MKKHLSVFCLIARSSIFKVILILVLSLIIQSAFFISECNNAFHAEDLSGDYIPDLERMVSLSAANVWFAGTVCLITLLLCIHGCEFGSKCSYTVKRLSVSEISVFFMQAAYNATVFIILLCSEIILTFFLSGYYLSAAPAEFISGQSVFLAFYRNEFLHSILPLEDIILWIRNALLFCTFSLATAFFPLKHRRGKISVAIFFIAVFSVIWNSGTIGADFSVIVAIFISLIMSAYILYYVIKISGEEPSYDS